MPTTGRRKRSRTRSVLYALPALFVMGLVILIVAAYLLPKPDAGAEVQAIMKEVRDDKAKHAAAAAAARKAMPADAPIPATWDFRPILDALKGDELDPLMMLVRSCLIEGDSLSDATVAQICKVLARQGAMSAGNPFYFSFTQASVGSTELKARLSDFLRQSKPLREVEAGYKLGLMQDVANAYRVTLDSNLLGMGTLFAGRALCELEAGDAPAALETALTAYGIAELFEDWPHQYAAANRYVTDQQIHRVLWRFIDAGSITPADQQRVLQALDRLKPVDRLRQALLFQGASNEIGEEADYRGYPKVVSFAFAFAGRGAFGDAKQLVSLLGTPPYQAGRQLEALDKHKTVGYRVNSFVDKAILAYRTHWRESMMGDVARLVFALKQWRQEHGAYPPSLQELQPFPLADFPKDPLTGEPVTYQPEGTTFTLTGGSGTGPFWGETYWRASK